MLLDITTIGGYGRPRQHEVSLPRINALLEAPSRYRLPTDPAPALVQPQGRPRGPQLRTMVRLVLEREEFAPRRR